MAARHGGVLVTGGSGLIGGHLVHTLASRGIRVTHVSRTPPDRDVGGQHVQLDLCDPGPVNELIRRQLPDAIVHLAAQSSPRRSWQDAGGTLDTNIKGALVVLEAVRNHKPDTRVLLAGSSGEYATGAAGPIPESFATGPTSPYAVSKVAQTLLGECYHRVHGMDVLTFRPFFVIGPWKIGDAASDFARGIASIEKGKEYVLRVGDLSPVRDFMDVGDAVEAIVCLMESGRAGEIYNVATGSGISVRKLLDLLLGHARVPIEVVERVQGKRSWEDATRIGDPTKLEALGWSSRTPLAESAGTILAHWRALV